MLRGGRCNLNLVLSLGHPRERAIKALLVLAVKVDMGVRRFRPRDQLVLELESVPHHVLILGRRDSDRGAIILGSKGRADPSLRAQECNHRDQSAYKQLAHSSLLVSITDWGLHYKHHAPVSQFLTPLL